MAKLAEANYQKVEPSLRKLLKFTPRFSFNANNVWIIQKLSRLPFRGKYNKNVLLSQQAIPRKNSKSGKDNKVNKDKLNIRIHTPKKINHSAALLWIHGGGHIIGSARQDDFRCSEFANDLGIVVVAPDYRLAPQQPFPADLDDCYDTLLWMFENCEQLGIDPNNIMIGGASAGGGLAASLAQYAFDKGVVLPSFQLLVYPMLDDRTVLRTDIDERDIHVWLPKSNDYAWSVYLQNKAGAETQAEYAVPARRENLAGLAPAWIGVGSLDLFYDENLVYEKRLKAAGVACELTIVEGAYHGFDIVLPNTPPAKDFYQSMVLTLRNFLEN